MEHQIVLIIDDSPEVTEGLAMTLERDDRVVVTCNDAESASVIIDHFQLSFIVSDINFSGPFGFEGLDIVSLARRRNVPIALISGAVSDQLREEALRLGVVAVLQKPFDSAQLESVLEGGPAA